MSNYDDINAGSTRDDIMGNEEELPNAIPPTTSIGDIFAIIKHTTNEYKKRTDEIEQVADDTRRSVAEMRSQIERLNDFLSRPRRRTTPESSRSSSHSPPRREYLASRTEQPITNNPTSENNPSTSRANQNLPDYPQHRLDILSPRATHQLSPKDYLQAIPHFDGTPMGYEADEFIVQCRHVKEYIPPYSEN
ncbi:hypothetical protein PV328_011834 [Microctonus aethiopoides]|uniref:Uncharacterized protein n=1 Tax=Microctonus aethiopoides TaxID=144406 RepID=A0AA39KQ47_9HYME|nr:hypothetical protein PV328_011834 [Microctonus aethiopoides]